MFRSLKHQPCHMLASLSHSEVKVGWSSLADPPAQYCKNLHSLRCCHSYEILKWGPYHLNWMYKVSGSNGILFFVNSLTGYFFHCCPCISRKCKNSYSSDVFLWEKLTVFWTILSWARVKSRFSNLPSLWTLDVFSGAVMVQSEELYSVLYLSLRLIFCTWVWLECICVLIYLIWLDRTQTIVFPCICTIIKQDLNHTTMGYLAWNKELFLSSKLPSTSN